MSKCIVFKCSFGGTDGWGHVVRCSALACEFLGRGWKTVLWSDGDLEKLPAEVASAFAVSSLDGAVAGDVLFVDEMYTEQAELEEIARCWRKLNPKAIVAGMDDMQRRSMTGFDLVLNTEIGLRTAGYLSVRSLLGERFALLRSGFSRFEKIDSVGDFEGLVPILIMIGGTDPFAFLPRVLKALSQVETPGFAPVIVGAEDGELSYAKELFPVFRVLRRVDSIEMAAWMSYCRLGIIGCGTSLYEAAAMDLPFLGLSIVDNQIATARKVETRWSMPILHLEEDRAAPFDLATPLLRLLEKERFKYSEVDTIGAARVCDALEVLSV